MTTGMGQLMRRFFTAVSVCASLAFSLSANGAAAQELGQAKGDALRVDLLEQARSLSMRDVYARSLYSHILANPAVFQNPNFYVGFLIYLMQQDKNFRCDNAFSSEFERRDFFTQSFNLQQALAQVIGSATIPERFDVAFIVSTGAYDFASSTLPMSSTQTIGLSQPLRGEIQSTGTNGNARYCARRMLERTNVVLDQFPWSFSIVNEAGNRNRDSGFPFGNSIQLPQNDARQLFQRFGRQLYAIVSYQVRAANDGSRNIQVLPTDGQLFGLSSDAVVRVRTYAHPTLSQANYLDLSNPLQLEINELRTTMDLNFQQQGFRAVGSGTRMGNGSDFSEGVQSPVTGSAAVGNSGFIMRLSSPQLLNGRSNISGLGRIEGADAYLTVFGNVDFERVTQFEAPVSGQVIVQTVNAQTGALAGSSPLSFTGRFRAPNAPEEQQAPAKQESQLDELSIDTPTVSETPQAASQE